MMQNISIALVGDCFITQRLPRDAKAQELKNFLGAHDVRFANLEILLHDFEVFAASSSGGTWAAARPDVLQDIGWLGFNMLAWANNHTLDWCHGGLLKTMEHLDRARWVHAGAGRNLAEAESPCYLDVPGGRVAMISVTSTMQDWHRAGRQRPDVLGRPGVNGLRYETVHHVRPEEFRALQAVADYTEVNANRRLDEKEGFAKPVEGGCFIGNVRFEVGEPGTVTRMHPNDAARIARSIHEAARQADVVLVSHHTHERKGMEKNRPADFSREFAKFCIDNGAHAYIGHGPHIWRGVEVYKRRPIFYSLGDFIFQNDSVEKQPAEFYDLYDLGPDNTPSDGFDARSANETRGLVVDRDVFESAAVSFHVENGKIARVRLKPLELGFTCGRSRRGRPYFSEGENGERILRGIASLSKPFGTKIEICDGEGFLDL